MAQGIDVGVHAHGDARDAAEALGDRLDARELARRFHVDRLDAEADGAFELGRRLPDAGEDDGRGCEARLDRQLDFPA